MDLICSFPLRLYDYCWSFHVCSGHQCFLFYMNFSFTLFVRISTSLFVFVFCI